MCMVKSANSGCYVELCQPFLGEVAGVLTLQLYLSLETSSGLCSGLGSNKSLLSFPPISHQNDLQPPAIRTVIYASGISKHSFNFRGEYNSVPLPGPSLKCVCSPPVGQPSSFHINFRILKLLRPNPWLADSFEDGGRGLTTSFPNSDLQLSHLTSCWFAQCNLIDHVVLLLYILCINT